MNRHKGTFLVSFLAYNTLIRTDGTTCLDVYYSIYDGENVKYKNRIMWDKWFLSHYYPLEN